MKKVVVVGTRGVPNIMGGVETHCEELFSRIAKMGYDLTIIRRDNYTNDNLTEWNGIKLVDIKAPKHKSLEAIVHTFKAINWAHKNKADVVHIHAIGPALLTPYAKLLGLKVVMTHHGPDYDRDKWGNFAKLALKLGERLGCKYADHVIVISDVIRNLIANKYSRTKNVHLIYNGVPKPDICEYPEYFEKLGLERGKYMLGMCRFVPEKNLHHLIDAFEMCDKKGHKLVLAGDSDFDDNYSRNLKEKARRAGVVLTGFIKGRELHSLLSNCKAYCLPSSHEGLPIALLEAMSYGARVIVSDIPANLEVGLEAKCYHHCGDVKDLSEKIQCVIDEAYSKVSYDMGKYDWEIIAHKVNSIYGQL